MTAFLDRALVLCTCKSFWNKYKACARFASRGLSTRDLLHFCALRLVDLPAMSHRRSFCDIICFIFGTTCLHQYSRPTAKAQSHTLNTGSSTPCSFFQNVTWSIQRYPDGCTLCHTEARRQSSVWKRNRLSVRHLGFFARANKRRCSLLRVWCSRQSWKIHHVFCLGNYMMYFSEFMKSITYCTLHFLANHLFDCGVSKSPAFNSEFQRTPISNQSLA